MDKSSIIALEKVAKRYGAEDVLHGIDLTLAEGEVVALVGHNGAGKTTLIKLMLGLTQPSAGALRVLGADPADASFVKLRQKIGFLPETIVFRGAMTGRETLRFFARLKDQPAAACERLLELVGLGHAADRRVSTYSKGMRQRLGLAQALLGAPRLLLLDEPTTGLDPSLRKEFYEIIARLRETGVTTLIASHALTEIEARTDRVAILRQGEMVAAGTIDALRRSANLPVRIRLSVAPGRAAAVAEQIGTQVRSVEVNGADVDLACLNGEKMAVLQRLAEITGPVQDVDIRAPNLEDLYDHFVGAERPR